jgi:hypothetical protein
MVYACNFLSGMGLNINNNKEKGNKNHYYLYHFLAVIYFCYEKSFIFSQSTFRQTGWQKVKKTYYFRASRPARQGPV